MNRYFVLRYFIFSLVVAILSSLITKTAFAEDGGYSSVYTNSAFTSERISNVFAERLGNSRAGMIWRLGSYGESYSTANENSDLVGMRVDFLLRYKLMDNLNFDAGVRLTLESGYTQSIFGEIEPGSNVTPVNAVIDWNVTDGLNLKAGIISQRHWEFPLLFRRIAFPGISESYSWDSANTNFYFKLNAQQLIPTSATLGTRVREREDSPNLFTESISLGYANKNFKYEVTGSHFNFNKLPHQVAFESLKFGNTVDAGGPNTAQFVFDFNGWVLQNELEISITPRLAAQVNWSIIKNNAAPETYNDAQMITPSLAMDFKTFTLMPSVSFYFIESDAVPGFYNDFQFGHNNRQGINYSLMTEMKNWGVKFGAGFTDAKNLNPSVFQQDIKYFYLTMDIAYDVI